MREKTGGRKKGTPNKMSVFSKYNDQIITYFKEGNSINKTLKRINQENNESFSISGFHSYIKKMKLDRYLLKKQPKVVFTYKTEQDTNSWRINQNTIYFSCHKVRFPNGLLLLLEDKQAYEAMETILDNYEKAYTEGEVFQEIYEPICVLINVYNPEYADKEYEKYIKTLGNKDITYNYLPKEGNTQSKKKPKFNVNDYF